MDPLAWEVWVGSGRWAPAMSGASKPVIQRPEPGGSSVYAANVSVSFNRELGHFLAIFETRAGFAYTTSPDLTSWEPSRLFTSFSTIMSLHPSYPTLLDESAEDDQETASLNRLYYAEGVGTGSNHQLYRRTFSVRSLS